MSRFIHIRSISLDPSGGNGMWALFSAVPLSYLLRLSVLKSIYFCVLPTVNYGLIPMDLASLPARFSPYVLAQRRVIGLENTFSPNRKILMIFFSSLGVIFYRVKASLQVVYIHFHAYSVFSM